MIPFVELYPNLVKYIPNWLEQFYPNLAEFAKGDGYPCGNQGVFIPRNKKCWTHPKTGQKLKKPLTYQLYKEAKEKSQRSKTEKGRAALDDREKGLRKTAGQRFRKADPDDVQMLNDLTGLSTTKPIGDGTHESVPRSAEEYYKMMIKKGNKITKKEAEETIKSVKDWTNNGYGVIRENQQLGIFDQDAENIDKFIKNSTPFKGDVYRGISFDSEKEAIKWLRGKGNDGVLDNQSAHASWTSDLKIAKKFSAPDDDGVAVIVKAVNKTGASIRNLSKFDEKSDNNESEVIVSKGARHKVKRAAKKNGIIVVETEEI